MGQRSGVLNLGVDGIMLLGAFGAYYIALQDRQPLLRGPRRHRGRRVWAWSPRSSASPSRPSRGSAASASTCSASGSATCSSSSSSARPMPISTLAAIDIPLLDRIPALGHMFFKQNVLVYLAFLLVPVVAFVLNRTTFGMKIQAAGENPAAADSVGVSVDPDPLLGRDHRQHAGRAGGGDAADLRRDLPGEPDPERGLHRGRARLLRRLAPGRRHGRLAALRAR